MKYVLLDEADYITPNGQAALRGVMETYPQVVDPVQHATTYNVLFHCIVDAPRLPIEKLDVQRVYCPDSNYLH